MPYIIVGLGNVGRKYAGSRHNIGFEVVDTLAERRSLSFIPGKGDFYQAVSNPTVSAKPSFFNWLRKAFGSPAPETSDFPNNSATILLKPTTLMNRSGLAARQALEMFSVAPQQLIVVVDDFHLPLGRLRLRKGGSHGGHNGLKSIIEELETEDFPRLRVGIGPKPANRDIIGFVLGQFEESQVARKDTAVRRAADACDLILTSPLLSTPHENTLDIVAAKYNISASDPAPGSDGG